MVTDFLPIFKEKQNFEVTAVHTEIYFVRVAQLKEEI